MAGSSTSSKTQKRQKVFLAARAVFVGDHGHLRDLVAVKKVISSNEQPFREVIHEYGLQTVVDTVHSLLQKEVFQSDVKAKTVFPELYQVSTAQRSQHDAAELTAARSEAEAFGDISGSSQDPPKLFQHEPVNVQDLTWHNPSDVPSLFPVYLPYIVQHKLLNTVQRLLEDCCYDFATKWLPNVLKNHGWTCSEAVELGTWTRILSSHFQDFATEAATTLQSGDALRDLLMANQKLRHAAVHRVPTLANGIEQMLRNALELVKALRDTARMTKMESVLEDFRASKLYIELHKNRLENELEKEMRDIQEQRAALNRREEEAKKNVVIQDLENTKLISSIFERSISNLLI